MKLNYHFLYLNKPLRDDVLLKLVLLTNKKFIIFFSFVVLNFQLK